MKRGAPYNVILSSNFTRYYGTDSRQHKQEFAIKVFEKKKRRKDDSSLSQCRCSGNRSCFNSLKLFQNMTVMKKLNRKYLVYFYRVLAILSLTVCKGASIWSLKTALICDA